MTTYTHTADADVPAAKLFRYLADPQNLPRYFPRMTAAEPEGGDTVHVEAEVHGHRVESEAWLRADESERRLSWGAEGPDDYHGDLQIEEVAPGRSRITVTLHSVREAGSGEVEEGLKQTMATLAQAAAADEDREQRA